MEIAIIIVVVLIVLGILGSVYETLADAIGGVTVVVTLILCVIAFFAFGWKGVLIVASFGIGGAFLAVKFSETLREHDGKIKETAEINKKTQEETAVENNEKALKEELDKNCRWLGFMNKEMWRKKLPNYCNIKYSTNFDTITHNFAVQIEKQNITQNDDWFNLFIMYCVNHPQGATAAKMLQEVNCQQLRATHETPNNQLLKDRLEKGTHGVNMDVPALFKTIMVRDANSGECDYIYTPSEYAKKMYSNDNTSTAESHKNEINFNDL